MRVRVKKGSRPRSFLLPGIAMLLMGIGIGAFLVSPAFQSWFKALIEEGERGPGEESEEIAPEERRIREEVILKKMEEASAARDWRDFVPEYPRPTKLGHLESKERLKAFRESPEFKELDRNVTEFLRKKEDLLTVEPSTPSLREATDLTRLKDKGTEEVIARLLDKREKPTGEKPLEENLQLGIKGPLVSRKILQKPSPPSVKVSVEAEVELTLWVLPNGTVDRVLPTVKGDAELERVAIEYLKQWRFASLPKDEPQVEQWGTIPIHFKLQ